MKTVYLTSVNPLANGACVRGFSTAVKRVKSDWSCALGTNTMGMLMRVKIEGPKKQADYHPRAAVLLKCMVVVRTTTKETKY